MNRTYTREWYMAKVDRIREIISDAVSALDIIVISVLKQKKTTRTPWSIIAEYSRYDMSYMFFYSERPGITGRTSLQRRYPGRREEKKITGNCKPAEQA